MEQARTIVIPSAIDAAQARFVAKVYGWMGVALATSGLVCWYVMSRPDLMMTILRSQGLFIGLVIAQLGIVVALSAAMRRLSAMVATGLFFLYAALTGLTLSVVVAAFTPASLATTFFVTAGTFAATGIYGYTTKRDLTSVGSLAFMGLIGIIIASVVNIFLANAFLDSAIAYIGVVVFVGLAAWDTQKIKAMGPAFAAESEEERKGAVIGALALYLDFINLFLMLLRIFGRRR